MTICDLSSLIATTRQDRRSWPDTTERAQSSPYSGAPAEECRVSGETSGRAESRCRSTRVVEVDEPSDLDYPALSRAASGGADHLARLVESLSNAWSDAYRSRTPAANLYEFGPEPWTFLF